ncbi:hypothetical protein AA313_de0204188 [Arthrobotrys entomopaga]|nr:hypothetical protein AA313_de0204188 [Arthrobotrys entomopaga]
MSKSTYPSSEQLTFVLIHGAWHWGHSWDLVRKHLESAGHIVHSPTVPFQDKDGKTIHSLSQSIQGVLDYIEENKVENFVLVGHSWGGVVITDMATKIADGKIKRMIYHNAFVPAEGESQFDICPPFARVFYKPIADASNDNSFDVPFPVFRDLFIGDADLELAKEVHKTLRRQPWGLWEDKVTNTEAFYAMPPKIPRSVVFADGDCTIPLGMYETQAGKLGLYRFIRIPSASHEVMFTDPEALAKALILAGRE